MDTVTFKSRILDNFVEIMKKEESDNLLAKAVQQTLEDIYTPLKEWEITDIDIQSCLKDMDLNDWKFDFLLKDLINSLENNFSSVEM